MWTGNKEYAVFEERVSHGKEEQRLKQEKTPGRQKEGQ
jgi:hypothetical protein